MNILRIIYDWPPPWSGLAPHPYEITLSQVKRGHLIDIFCGRWPRSGNIIEPEGTTVHPFLREPLRDTIYFTTAVGMFFYYLRWRKKYDVDIIHLHGHFGIWILFYRNLLRTFGVFGRKELETPLVVHMHNTVQGRWNKLKQNNKKIHPLSKYIGYPLGRWSDKLAVKNADALIFVSDDNKNEAIEFYGANEKICYVVETGVNSELFRPVSVDEKIKTKQDLGLDENDILLLNHGVMLERKNIHILVEALSHLPSHFKLMLSGPFGSREYEEKIMDVISLRHLSDRVLLTGYTPYPQVPIAYQASDLFVLPSTFEGLPKALMQGLSCGIPCLASAVKLNEDIKGMYYLNEVTPEAVAKEIVDVLDEKVEVDVKKLSQEYSWDNRVAMIDQIYTKVTQNK